MGFRRFVAALSLASVAVPSLPQGKYRLQVALLDRRTHQPAIALGIAGRGPDGWYDLGEIALVSGGRP